MAVPEQTPYIEHTGNGVTTSFALKFQCESKDHLIVLVDEVEPPIATWSLTGGNVVFTTAPAAGKKITLQRNTPFSRATDYQSYNNSFRPPAVNKDFDWIWLKLQELGVADWILGARIDALKNYVDRKDDELKAYLMEEIRKQGVALDQLDEYYNYLMERLAQIAVDKGWDASFVVDGDKTQKQINDEQLAVNNATYSTVESVADMLAINSPKNKQKAQTLSFYSGLGRGGAYYIYDTTKSAINNGITIINGWVLQWDGKNLDLLQAGCYGDGDSDTPHEDGVKIGECLNILYALGSGSLQGRGFSYLNETTNYAINNDNVFIVNAKIIRNGKLNNWMFRTATTKEIKGGGFIKVEGKGNSTVVAGNGFISMGSNEFKHNKWVLQDIVADNFTQYGVGIQGGDYWYAKNIKVLNHGLTVGTMTACMGFYVYPRNPGGSKGGLLDTVYSEIGTAAQANSSLNAAAIKLQTHQNAKFSNIVAVGGFEQCFGIDSVGGEIKNVTAYPQGERPGVILGNQNSAHLFSGQKFTLDGFDVRRSSGTGNNDLLIGAGELGEYKLDGCTIKNGKTQGFFGLARTAFKDCVFENIECDGLRLSVKYQNLPLNTVLSTGNTFKNVKCKASGFILETNDSLIEDCGTTAKSTTAGVVIAGDGNIVIKPLCVSSVNGLTLYTGSLGNFIDSPITKAGTGRAIFFMEGTANNIIKQPTYLGSASVLNSGDATNRVEFVKSAGLTPASTAADIVTALQSAGLAT